MIICKQCGKEIIEEAYPTLQVVLGPVSRPWAADPRQHYHTKCLRDNIDSLALTTDEKKQALEVLSTL